ncbi:PREDICTED: piriformospora indica-insensitive protein 2 [Theobroma cacao]|uniref:Piriformospora indica-insensitive protein 2 n=1 Tax=Theobroma cacao TaxID=3641 RepID=A0AB32VA23_THECC|nr:PREDICTED: piriformospora indica-insensitive protein 2 [Theobroma cacao]
MKNPIVTIKNFLLLFSLVGLLVLCKCQEDHFFSMAPMEKREQEALYSAIQGFVGKWWNGSDLYPDPCGWSPIQGVYCDLFDGFWHVTVLNIGLVFDNSLQCSQDAKFTHHLFELTHLRSLSFFNCFFSPRHNPIRIPSSNWERLSNSLESLGFRSNRGLIGTIPTSIVSLKQLKSLVLLENGLTGELPIELGSLVNLRQLVLAGNRFTGQIPESFGGLTQLLIMDLSRNNLSGSLPLTFGGNFTSLLKLDLSSNKLEGKLPTEIGSLKNATLLDLGRNNFSGGLIESLEEMVSLKEVVLSNNPLGGDLMGVQWGNLQDLEILDLSNLGLTGKIPESMTEMKRLRYLGLNDNNLSGNLSPKIATLPSLGALYINGNNLTGKLEFSGGFYKKMGRRFRAWNNSNLCYQAEMISSLSHVPNGVKSLNGDDGWIAPKHDNQIYNKWASSNRFKVDDTIHFKYKKDSVLVVTQEEYDKCQPSHPQFFSNNGDTVFKLDRAGLFYFMSGVTGHCQKGQKMIIKVLEPDTPPQSQNQNSTTNTPEHEKNGAFEVAAVSASTIMLLVMSAFI